MLIHSFPYKSIKPESKIVIYGCGIVGKEYIAQIEATDWCQLRYIIDNGGNVTKYKNYPVITYEIFKRMSDRNTYRIVIAIADKRIAKHIIKELKLEGMPEGQIVWEDVLIKIPVECTKDAVKFDVIPFETVDDEMVCIQKQMIKSNLMISEVPRSITNCGRKEEFVNLLAKFTRANKYNYLDMPRLVNFMLNITKTIENIGGSVAELGVYQGDTASILASFCQKKSKKLFLFDTFEGFSQKDLIEIDRTREKLFAETSLAYVENIIEKSENVYFIKGYFPDSAIEISEDERYCFVHIDCDLYYPIKSGLEYFWPKLNVGGMIMVHDYSSGHWEGATKAVDEFCNLYNISVVLIPDLSGSVILTKNEHEDMNI